MGISNGASTNQVGSKKYKKTINFFYIKQEL